MNANTGFDIAAARNKSIADFVDSTNKGENGMARLAYTMFYSYTNGVGDERFPFNPADMVTPGSDKVAERMERALIWFGVKRYKDGDASQVEWNPSYHDAFRRSFPQAVKRAAMIAGAMVKCDRDKIGSSELRQTVLVVPACILAGGTDTESLGKLGKGTDAADPIKLNGSGGASLRKAHDGAKRFLGFPVKRSKSDSENKRPANASEAADIAKQLGNYLRVMGNSKPTGDLRNELIAVASMLDHVFTSKDIEEYEKKNGSEEDAA